MFKTETHLHTAEISPCGRLAAREMAEAYKRAGYTTIFVTDHFEEATMKRYGDIPWAEKVERHFEGFRNALEAGRELGLNVIAGAEIELTSLINHYLIFGDVINFLGRHEKIYELPLEDLYALCKEEGILLIQAHPFRDSACFPTPDFVDGFEVYNSNKRHEDFSRKTLATAKEHGGIMLSGSDSHRHEDVAGGGIITKEPIVTAEDFVRIVKSGEFELIKEGKRVYLAADTHANPDFPAVLDYLDTACEGDILILLGDQEFGFDHTEEAVAYTKWFTSLGKPIAFIDGNHDNMDLLATYPEEEWRGGKIRRINENIIYLPRGEIYTFGEKRVFVFGGCKSSSHWRSLGKPTYEAENPTAAEVDYAIKNLESVGNKVDYILTHKYEDGTHDNITEELLRLCNYIEENVAYRRWYYGHWHSDATPDKKHRQIYDILREMA